MLPGPQKKSPASLCVLCVATLLCWSPARAAEPAGPPEPPKPPAAPEQKPAKPPETKPPEEIVVTASRIPTEEKRSGVSTSVVTGEELATRRPAALWEEVRQTPGVTFVQSGTRGQLTSLFMRGGDSGHTLVLVDGFKVNDDDGTFPWETLSPAGAGRVEVLRGAASALYGAEAMTGVVQVFTAKGSGPARLGASSEAGTYHTFRETAQLVGADGPVAYNLNLSRLDMTEGRFRNSDVHSTTFAGRLDWDLPSSVHAKLIQRVVGDEVGDYGRDNARDPDGRAGHRRELTGLEFSGRLLDLVDSRLLLGRSLTRFTYDDQINAVSSSNIHTANELERLSAEWQNTARIYQFGPAVGTLTVGLAGEDELGRINSAFDDAFGDSGTNRIDRARSAMSAYAEKRLELWEALSLDAGVRAEDHSTFGTKVATRLAAGLWIERTGTRVHGSWGQGFKSPSFFQNFAAEYDTFPGMNTMFTQGNLDLRPEKVTSVDAGIEERLFDERLIVGVTVFRNRFKDFISWEYVSTVGTVDNFTFLNAGEAEAEGIEYELAVKPAEWARARAALTITHTEAITDRSSASFADGRPLIRRPERVASASAEFEPFKPWSAAPDWTRRLTTYAELVHQAESVDVNYTVFPSRRVDLPEFTEVNVGLNWEICKSERQSLRLFGRWENVGDVRIEQVYDTTGDKSRFLGGAGYTLAF